VFVCTTPIGTRGGDPIEFARRGVVGAGSAWLFVIDLPRDTTIHGAVPNDELERYWKAHEYGEVAFREAGRLHTLIDAVRHLRVSTHELLRYRVVNVVDGLCDGPPDADTLVQFAHAYVRAHREHKRRVAASYGLRVPDWHVEDSHLAFCMACMGQLFEVEIVAPDAGGVVFRRGSWHPLDLTTFGVFTDAIDRWLAAHGDPAIASLAQLQASYEPPRDRVPRVLWRDFAIADLAARMRGPDTQLLLGHVPPAQIVGAIDLGTADRLSKLVRPAAGETLLRKLEYLAKQLVEQRRRTGKPVVLR